MDQYLNMLGHVIETGTKKPTRARLASTGKKVDALSVFGYQTRFDLSEGFPAVTTKRLAFRLVVLELLWFLRGSTDARELQAEGCHIWDQWANSETGDVGPVYGRQWRSWACPDGGVIDQMAQVVDGIKAVKADPTASVGRRLLVSAWNPADVPKMRLPCCHVLFQFSVTNGRLSCHLYQRSGDAMLGVPFNIASYALLTHMVAHATGLEVGEFVHSFGDLHIYENHLPQVREQITREPFPMPKLIISAEPGRDLFGFHPGDFALDGYVCHPSLKAEVAI